MSFQVGDEVIVLADFGTNRGIVELAGTVRKIIAASGAAGGIYQVRYADQETNRRFGRQAVVGRYIWFQLSVAEVADQLAVAAAFTR